MKRSDFDLDFETGTRAEAWVAEVLTCSTVEVKAPAYFLRPDSRYGGRQLAYIEYEARSSSGIWAPSGIAVTKATVWALKFGGLPGMLCVEADWLYRAARLAWKRGQRQDNDMEPNPTHGVLVGLEELWETQE